MARDRTGRNNFLQKKAVIFLPNSECTLLISFSRAMRLCCHQLHLRMRQEYRAQLQIVATLLLRSKSILAQDEVMRFLRGASQGREQTIAELGLKTDQHSPMTVIVNRKP